MFKNFLRTVFMFVAMTMGVNAWAEDLNLDPSGVTYVCAGTPDEAKYDAAATSWLANFSKLSGGKLTDQLAAYGGSTITIVKFDASSLPANATVTNASLTFNSACTVAGKNSQLAVSTIGTDWDATTATWNNVDLSATFVADLAWSAGNTAQSADVKTVLAADEDKVVAFAIYTNTGREQSVSNFKLNVSYTTAAIAEYEYTVNAVDGAGNILSEIETGKCLETDNKVVYAPYAVNKDGKWYVIEAETFANPITASGVVAVTYQAKDDVVAFVDLNNDAKGDYSAGAVGHTSGTTSNMKTGASLGNVAPGKYKAVTVLAANGKRGIYIRDINSTEADNTIATMPISGSSSAGKYETDEFVITAATDLIVTGYTSGSGANQSADVDYVALIKTGDYEEPMDEIVLDVVDPSVEDDDVWNIYENEDYKIYFNITKNLPLDPTRTYTLEDMNASYSFIYSKNDIVTNDYGTKNWQKYEYTSASVKIGANNELEAIVEAKNGEDVIKGKFVFNNPNPITVTLDGETEYIADFNAYAVSAKNKGSELKADYSVQLAFKGDAYESKTTFTEEDLLGNANSVRVATVETKISSANITLTVGTDSQTYEGTVVGADEKTYAINVTTNIPSKEAKKETVDFGAVLEVSEDEGDIKFVAENADAKFVGYITVNPVTTNVPSGEYDLLSYTKYGVNSDFGYMLDAVEDGKVTVTNNEGEISIVATFKQNNVEYTVTAKAGASDPEPEMATITITKGEKVITVTSSNETYALQTKFAPMSSLEEGQTPETVVLAILDEMDGAFSSAQEFNDYYVQYATKGEKEIDLEGIEEVYPGEKLFIAACNIAWSPKEGKPVLASNIAVEYYDVKTPEKPIEMTLSNNSISDYTEYGGPIQWDGRDADGNYVSIAFNADGSFNKEFTSVMTSDMSAKFKAVDGSGAITTAEDGTKAIDATVNFGEVGTYHYTGVIAAPAPCPYGLPTVKATPEEITFTFDLTQAVEGLTMPQLDADIVVKKGEVEYNGGISEEDVVDGKVVKTIPTYLFAQGWSNTLTLEAGDEIEVSISSTTLWHKTSGSWEKAWTGEMEGSVKATVEAVPVPVSHTWDFTNWSEETKANLKADAATNEKTEDGVTFFEGTTWTYVEKTDTDKNGNHVAIGNRNPQEDKCYWQLVIEKTPTANGVAIKEFEGLEFACTKGGKENPRSLAIAVDYPSTSLGEYHGAQYLWLGGSGIEYFTIKNVKVGSTIKMGVESHKLAEGRGVTLTNVEANPAAPKTFEEQTWTVTGEGEVVDVTVTNTNGCHIYYIDAEINDVPSGIQNISVNENVVGKFVENGKIVIVKNGKKFSVNGFQIK